MAILPILELLPNILMVRLRTDGLFLYGYPASRLSLFVPDIKDRYVRGLSDSGAITGLEWPNGPLCQERQGHFFSFP